MNKRIHTSFKSFMIKEENMNREVYPDPYDDDPPSPYRDRGYDESGTLVLDLFINSTMNNQSENIPLDKFKSMVNDFDENVLKVKLDELKSEGEIYSYQIIQSPLLEDNYSDYTVKEDMVDLESLYWSYSVEYYFENMDHEIDRSMFKVDENVIEEFINKYEYLKSYDYEESSYSELKNNY